MNAILDNYAAHKTPQVRRWLARMVRVQRVSTRGESATQSPSLDVEAELERRGSVNAGDCVVVLAVSSERVSSRKQGIYRESIKSQWHVPNLTAGFRRIFSWLPENSLRTGTGNFRFRITEVPAAYQAIADTDLAIGNRGLRPIAEARISRSDPDPQPAG